MHSPEELKYLAAQTCPICGKPLDYDDGYLHCLTCRRGWKYRDFKDDERAFQRDPQSYIEIYQLKASK